MKEGRIFSRRIFLGGLALASLGNKDTLRLANDLISKATELEPEVKIEEVFEVESVIDHVTLSLAKEAFKKRQERKMWSFDYKNRIDEELNKNRLNFLLSVDGETNEPPLPKAFIRSSTVLSVDLENKTVSATSFTHDIRAPEIERHRDNYPKPIKIYRAFDDGGFDLSREVFENATGLVIDYQINANESVFKDVVDDVFGQIEVENPLDFVAEPIFYQGVKYSERTFQAGKEFMDGVTVLQYIKSIARSNRDRRIEHNARKHLVLRAIREAVSTDKLKFPQLLTFTNDRLNKGQIVYDSDYINMRQILGNNIGLLLWSLTKAGNMGNIPEVDNTVYIVDSAHGDGGVQWVKAQYGKNPAITSEIDRQYYEKIRIEGGDPYAFAIPIGGDPYAVDLVTGYWKSVRDLIKNRLTRPSS